jgi:uncharacterized protein YjbI with pentapeptide repeats
MANESHLSLLEKGVKAWNEWRLEHESDQADLSEASLTGADLGNADLSKADLIPLPWFVCNVRTCDEDRKGN